MKLKDKGDKHYLVYKSPTEFVEVEANTAQEAIDASGIERPHKVRHIVRDLEGVLRQSMLEKIEEKKPAPANTDSAEVVQEAAQAEQRTEVPQVEEIAEPSQAEEEAEVPQATTH